MTQRPLVLHGGEYHPDVPSVFDDPTLRFDGQSGLWINDEGLPAVLHCGVPGTTKTATREGIDSPEVVGFSTMRTKSREGVDQSDVIGFSTHSTRTREGIDQAEVSEPCMRSDRASDAVKDA